MESLLRQVGVIAPAKSTRDFAVFDGKSLKPVLKKLTSPQLDQLAKLLSLEESRSSKYASHKQRKVIESVHRRNRRKSSNRIGV